MAVYDLSANALATVYGADGTALAAAYDIGGEMVFPADGPFVPTTLTYDTNWLITSAWLTNAETQRDAVLALYQQSEDAIPFFIQTDGHGRYNEGNKGCHNLAEPVMRYIPNIMLGDYASYYSSGNNPANHAASSAGITNYLPVMGNHEFMRSSSDQPLADLPTLIASYTPGDGILGSQTYGYYKVLDDRYNVKWLVGQPHIPDANDSDGFSAAFTSDQWQWFIDEMEAEDGYDIVVLHHEPFTADYTWTDSGETTTYSRFPQCNLSPVLAARKAKTSGVFTDPDGVTHSYDFTGTTSDLLCVLHGHTHAEAYFDKTQYGYPGYVGTDFTNAGDCVYGLIDRAGGYLYIYGFTKNAVNEAITLEL